MGRYIVKRVLLFVPTLLIITLLAFIISVQAPGDPLDRLVSTQDSGGEAMTASANTLQERERWRKKLGLDLPVFYFSVTGAATPDTIYKIYDERLRNTSKRLIRTYGNWDAIASYQRAVISLRDSVSQIRAHMAQPGDSAADVQTRALLDSINNAYFILQSLPYDHTENGIDMQLSRLAQMDASFPALTPLSSGAQQAQQLWASVTEHPTRYKNYIPAVHVYGYNQFHRWVFGDGHWLTGAGSTDCQGILRGDFGYSYTSKLPMGDVIGARIRWSLFFTLVSVLLAYLISIPIGIKAASKKDSMFDRSSSVILFILYSMPTFWVATLLLMTFANPLALPLFPASGVEPPTGIADGSGWLEMVRIRLPYLILPTITYTYAQLAFLSRITRVSVLEVAAQDFIRTARAKGLDEGKVFYKHAFRNALLPLITVFSNIFPAAIGGSVILETIFSIPGMGQQIFQAILSKDYPVIISVFTLTGIFTLIGYLVADILYALADPRISYHQK